MFVIRNLQTGTYWSQTKAAWVSIRYATYLKLEDVTAPLQPHEELIQLWQVPELQMARFIAECEAAGLFAAFEETVYEEVGDSMGLEKCQLDQIVKQAQSLWDHSKSKLPGRMLEAAALPTGKYRFKLSFEQAVREEVSDLEIVTDAPLHELHHDGYLSETDWFETVNEQHPDHLEHCVYEVHERDLIRLEMLEPEQRTIFVEE